jgi:hypothetical protein
VTLGANASGRSPNHSYPQTVEDVVESDCSISDTDVQRKFKRMKIAEEQGTGRCFLVVVQNWIATTLLEVIKEWILPGTTIISDCWKAYDKIVLVFVFHTFFQVNMNILI